MRHGGWAVVLFLLTCSPARAGEEWFAPGETKTVSGRTHFVFWTDEKQTRYALLPQGTKADVFLKGAEVAKPPRGIQVKNLTLQAAEEEGGGQKGRMKTTYRQYALTGTWEVTVPKDCPPGDYTIQVRFPAVDEYRDQLGAIAPQGVSVPLYVKVFASAEERSKEEGNFNRPLGWACFAIVVLMVMGGFGVILAKRWLG